MLFLYPLFFIFLKKNFYIDFSLILIRCMNNSSFVKILQALFEIMKKTLFLQTNYYFYEKNITFCL